MERQDNGSLILVVATALAMSLTGCATQTTGTGQAERLAFVASEADGNMVIIDLNTEKVRKILPTGKVPHTMAVAPGGKIFVNNRGAKDLTVIDGLAAQVAGSVSLPARSFQLALAPDEKTLAVTYIDANRLSLVDVSTRVIVKTVELGKRSAGEFKGAMTKHPYWSPDGRFVYVADAVNKVIAKVDVAQGKVANIINIDGVNHYLHPSPDGKLLFAVKDGQNFPATEY